MFKNLFGIILVTGLVATTFTTTPVQALSPADAHDMAMGYTIIVKPKKAKKKINKNKKINIKK